MSSRVSIPRLSSVRLKSGGAKLHIFQNTSAIKMRLAYEDIAKGVLVERAEDLIGFVIVAWSRDGSVSSGVQIEDGRYVSKSQTPEFVKTIVHNTLFS